MTLEPQKPRVRRRLPPAIYKSLFASLVWLVAASLGFLGGRTQQPEYGIWYAVVAGFAAVVVLIVVNLVRLWRRVHPENATSPVPTDEWLHDEFETWQKRLPAKSAVVAILIAPMAAAIAMTALAIIVNLARSGAI